MSRIGVVGAGLMGSGIAQVAAVAGHEVLLRDVAHAPLERGLDVVQASLARFVTKQALSDDDATAALARITTTTDLEAFSDIDLVVEAVFEQLEVKHEVFRILDRVCRPDAVLATNTSALPITSIAAVTSSPSRVIGMHFFSPVPMMRLCELVLGLRTSEETLAAARAFAESTGKTCVVVKRDIAGFVTTRLLTVLALEAVRLVESGVATAEDVDTACRLGFGHPMGPLETLDLTGLDIMTHAADNIWMDTRDPKFAPPEGLRRMVRAGLLGRKSGQGFYPYG
jgi:3-hydroxybutyryl-CoA dehydrogenase